MIIQLYKLLMTLIFPVIKTTYIQKRRRKGKEHPTRFHERIGKYKIARPEGKLYWFHGASVGEAVSMLPLIQKLLDEDKDLHIMVTTGTVTSADVMQKRLPERAFHQFIPFDVPLYASRLLKHFRPNAVLWFESEFWPSMLSAIHARKIPLILVNGRVSDKSFKTWKHFKSLSKTLLSYFTLCLGQSEQDKNRLTYLGAERAACIGNIKYAGQPLPINPAKAAEFRAALGDRPVFLLSSTHHNEEEQFAAQIHSLQELVPNILVLVVPRHPERGIEIAFMLRRKGFEVSLRSKNEPLTETTDIYVADTIGEMGLWYSVSPACFVGGSLIPHGGQNFIEPARDSCAIIVGQYMQNFTEILSHAKVADAVWQVNSAADVIDYAIDLYRDKEFLQERQQKALAWAKAEAAVLDKISLVLKKELKR